MAGKILKRRGVPSTYTEEIGEKLCTLIAGGKSLRSICGKVPGMPKSMHVVWDWRHAHPEFDTKYARARCDQADAHVEEMLDVARRASKTSEQVNDKRILVDTLKWRASKMKPKNYGDRLVVEAEINVREMTDEQLRNRVTELLARLGPKTP